MRRTLARLLRHAADRIDPAPKTIHVVTPQPRVDAADVGAAVVNAIRAYEQRRPGWGDEGGSLARR